LGGFARKENMQEKTGLLPCPFCGQEKPSLWQSGGYWKIKCVDGCSISISGYFEKSGAIKAWNRRPTPYAPDKSGDSVHQVETVKSVLSPVESTSL